MRTADATRETRGAVFPGVRVPLRRPADDAAFEDFVRGSRGQLVTTARLLCAGDAHAAEDLVQTTLVKLFLGWRRIRTDPAAYARRTLVNCFLDQRRRAAARREVPAETLPDRPAPEPEIGGLDPVLVAALAELPPRMRAAVVLRHVHDLSVDAVAELLGCEPGTVKSQTARGLDKLRASLASPTTRTGVGP